MNRLASRVLVGVAVALTVMLVRAVVSEAAVYANDPYSDAAWVNECPSTDDACLALAERLESIAMQLETLGIINTTLENRFSDVIANTQYLNDNLPQIRSAVETTASNGGTISGVVALSDDDRERLDLGWWGTWAIVGLVLVLMVAQPLLSVMRTDRGL